MVIRFQKGLMVAFLSAFSRGGGLFKVIVGAEVMGLSLECNFRAIPAVFLAINPRVTGGIVTSDFADQRFNAGIVYKMQPVVHAFANLLPDVSAADRAPVNQGILRHLTFLSAAAAAPPINGSGSGAPAGRRQSGQLAKLTPR